MKAYKKNRSVSEWADAIIKDEMPLEKIIDLILKQGYDEGYTDGKEMGQATITRLQD